jgi:hypothetical protein
MVGAKERLILRGGRLGASLAELTSLFEDWLGENAAAVGAALLAEK